MLARSFGQADHAPRTDLPLQHYYRANRRENCPEGYDDEDAVRVMWEEPDPAQYTDKPPTPGSETADGLMVPEPVTVVGQLQPLLGGVPGDASCPWSRLHHRGSGRFSARFVIPVSGEFTFTITNGGTMTDPTNQGVSRVVDPGEYLFRKLV